MHTELPCPRAKVQFPSSWLAVAQDAEGTSRCQWWSWGLVSPSPWAVLAQDTQPRLPFSVLIPAFHADGVWELKT